MLRRTVFFQPTTAVGQFPPPGFVAGGDGCSSETGRRGGGHGFSLGFGGGHRASPSEPMCKRCSLLTELRRDRTEVSLFQWRKRRHIYRMAATCRGGVGDVGNLLKLNCWEESHGQSVWEDRHRLRACSRRNARGRILAGTSACPAKWLGRGRVAHLHVHSDGNHSQPFGGGGVEAHR